MDRIRPAGSTKVHWTVPGKTLYTSAMHATSGHSSMKGIAQGALLVALICLIPFSGRSAALETFPLWNGTPPLPVVSDKPEGELPLEKGNHPDIVRLANVTEPTLTVFQPPKEKRNGTAVLICPGGGYHILATKHEGTQVAEWLNSLGVTAFLLKYRVPSPKTDPVHRRPLLDAQRAMSIIRSRAKHYDIQPDRIGVLGFSAGGHLAAWLMCEGNRRSQDYPLTQDEAACRPDFGILIYPAYLTSDKADRPSPKIRPDEKPGPAFLVHAHDDGLTPENSVQFYLDLKRAGVDAELHVYQHGGHGFGMLPNGQPINQWPDRCADWFRATQLIK